MNKWAHNGPVAWPPPCCLARWPLAMPQEQASAQPASDLLDVYQPPANTKKGSRPLLARPVRSAPFDTPPATKRAKTDRGRAFSSEAEKDPMERLSASHRLTQQYLAAKAHLRIRDATAVQALIALRKHLHQWATSRSNRAQHAARISPSKAPRCKLRELRRPAEAMPDALRIWLPCN